MQGNRQFNSGAARTNGQQFAIEALLKRLHVAAPVRVVAVHQDADTGQVGHVDVLPLLSQVDGEGRTWPPSTLYRQPFLRIQGGANAVCVNPQVGDIGLSVFADRDISVVSKTRGGPVQPGTARFCDAADGLYLGGFLNKDAERYVLIADDGITIEGMARITAHGTDTTINAEGSCTVNAAGGCTINAAAGLTVNGDVLINGSLTWTGTAQGRSGPARFRDGLSNTGGSVESNGIVLERHVHTGVEPGPGNTGGPE